MPSWLVACWAKMSRISATRSTTSRPKSVLEIALLRGRELVVEHHDVDVERLRELGAAPRPSPCPTYVAGSGRSRRCSSIATGSAPAVSVRSASSSSDCSASSTCVRAEAGADEQRALADDLEIDLGRGEALTASPRPFWRPLVPVVGIAGHAALLRVEVGRIDVDVEHVHDRTTEADRVTDLHDEVAARDVHGDRGHPRGRADGRRPRPHTHRCRTTSVSPTPRSHTRIRRLFIAVGSDELDVGAPREPRVVLEMGTVLRDACGGDVVDEQHEMRIAHSGGVAAVLGAVVLRGEVERPTARRAGSRRGSKVTGPMSTVAAVTLAVGGAVELDDAPPAAGVDDERCRTPRPASRRDPGQGIGCRCRSSRRCGRRR